MAGLQLIESSHYRPAKNRRGAVAALDAQVLVDLKEEQFYLPARLVERSDGQRRQVAVGRQKYQAFAGVRIAITDATQVRWVVLRGEMTVQGDGLRADQSAVAIDRCRVQLTRIEVALDASDEEVARLVGVVEPSEVEIIAIDDLERTRLRQQQVEHVDVVEATVGDVDKAANRAA